MLNVEKLMELLPKDYEEKCFATKAIERVREIKTPKDLMTLALSYVAHGFSMLEMSEIARLRGIAKLSDVAFMGRFAKCKDWFVEILKSLEIGEVANYPKPHKLSEYNIKALDATDVTEKGAVKRSYKLHYAINLFTMSSESYKITPPGVGESLTHFAIKPKDLIIGDRGYGSKTSIEHCLSNGGDFILRVRNNPFKLYDAEGSVVKITDYIEQATVDSAIDTTVYMERTKGEMQALRLCITKKPPEATARTARYIKRLESTGQRRLTEETKRAHAYFFVLTSLPSDVASAEEVLGIYRLRWQVELYFKRLKSIMNFGDLPKRHEQGVLAWLNAKLIVALLIEKSIAGVDFSPSGEGTVQQEHLA